MCGVSFLFSRRVAEHERRQRVEAALGALKHRGPDEAGVWQGESAAMGHRRLSIIDLSHSQQPMLAKDGRYALSYNGEIYNFKELRQQLSHRWRFATGGDTEVVLAGLVLEGADFLEALEGMWALALWDCQEQRLLLARDRMGEKPLFFCTRKDEFYCASELPALKLLIKSPLTEDLDSTADYFRYGFCLPGTTPYQEVHEVLPGHALMWAPYTTPQQVAYWHLPEAPDTTTIVNGEELVREKLYHAVTSRLVADVEVGAFLSGGIDSSLIVALASRTLGNSLQTFTVGFSEASYDESAYAKHVSQHFGTRHFLERFELDNAASLENLLISHVGAPFADPSLLPTALVAQVASRHVKVVLSGDGGDELFGGYERYRAKMLLRWYSRLPNQLTKNLARLIRYLPEPTSHHSRSILKKAHLFLEAYNRHGAHPYIAPAYFADEQFNALFPDLTKHGHSLKELPEVAPDDLRTMMYRDAAIYLPQDILVKVDRATMAHSLEARAPFLDSDLVKLAFSLPRYWHHNGIQGKRMLRRAFKHILPGEVWRRRKQGFGVPLGRWFQGRLGDRLTILLEKHKACINVAAALELLRTHRSGRRDYGSALWCIYSYLLWQSRQEWLQS